MPLTNYFATWLNAKVNSLGREQGKGKDGEDECGTVWNVNVRGKREEIQADIQYSYIYVLITSPRL